MECSEQISNIIRIEAYPFKAITLSIPFTNRPFIQESAVKVSGTPVVLSLKQDDSAQAESIMSRASDGISYTNTLNWQTDDLLNETLEQIGVLSANPHHFILHTYSGTRKFIYNWCSFGKVSPTSSMSGGNDTMSLSFSIKSRIPILTLL